MKSSYELAMERLAKATPLRKLTPEQIANIQEIDSIFTAKIAERETMMQSDIAAARAAGSMENVQMLMETLAREVKKLRDECEERKEKVRQAA